MLNKPKILIVDDEPFNVDYLEQELEDLDYETISAFNGREALEQVEASLEKKRFRDQEVEYLRQVDRLTEAAAAVEADTFDPDSLSDVAAREDALGQLTRLFQRMAREFQAREQRLKQQVRDLRIEVDQTSEQRQVEKIMGTAYFKNLRDNAQKLRDSLEETDE